MRRTAAVAMAIVQMIKNFRIIVQTVQRRHQAANWHKIDKKLSGRKAHEINSHRQLILKPSGEAKHNSIECHGRKNILTW